MEELDQPGVTEPIELDPFLSEEPLGLSRLGTLSEIIGKEAADKFFEDNPPFGSRRSSPGDLPRMRPSRRED